MLRARDNPFSTARVLQLRYRLSESGWDELLSRLERMNYRGALVGPHGAGKTTLLGEVGDRLADRGFEIVRIRLNTANRSIPKSALPAEGAGARQIVLLDGCEQLSPLAWWRFRWHVRRAGGLVITTHAAGRLPTLRECHTSPALLADLLAQLQHGRNELSPPEIEGLYRKHQGNLREALRELYDRAAGGSW